MNYECFSDSKLGVYDLIISADINHSNWDNHLSGQCIAMQQSNGLSALLR